MGHSFVVAAKFHWEKAMFPTTDLLSSIPQWRDNINWLLSLVTFSIEAMNFFDDYMSTVQIHPPASPGMSCHLFIAARLPFISQLQHWQQNLLQFLLLSVNVDTVHAALGAMLKSSHIIWSPAIVPHWRTTHRDTCTGCLKGTFILVKA